MNGGRDLILVAKQYYTHGCHKLGTLKTQAPEITLGTDVFLIKIVGVHQSPGLTLAGDLEMFIFLSVIPGETCGAGEF